MKRLIIIFTSLAISMIFAHSAFAGMDDKSDKLSNEQSNVFSPGYINASKQKTDAIIYQQNKPKTLMENIAEYVKNKMGRKIEEGAMDKPAPQLKRKTSQGGDSKSQQEQTIQVAEESIVLTDPGAVTANTADTPVQVRNGVNEYLNNRAGTIGDYQITAAGDQYLAFWTESSTLKGQVFDKAGRALNSSVTEIGGMPQEWSDFYSQWFPGITVGMEAYDPGLTPDLFFSISSFETKTYANGNVALFWQEKDSMAGLGSFKMQVFGTNGQALLANSYNFGGEGSQSGGGSFTTLSNGNLAVTWNKWNTPNSFGSAGSQDTQLQIFDTSGRSLLGNGITVANAGESLSMAEIDNVGNGNFAVFFNDTAQNSSLLVQVYNGSGDALSDKYRLSNGPVGSGRLLPMPDNPQHEYWGGKLVDVNMFDNGNFSIIWGEGNAIKAQVFSSAGQAILANPMTIANNSLTAINDIKEMDNGNIAVFWEERDPTTNMYNPINSYAKMQILDSNGNAFFDGGYTLGGGTGGIAAWVTRVTVLEDGKLALAIREIDRYQRNTMKFQMLDSSGVPLLGSGYQLTNTNLNTMFDKVISYGNGNIAVIWTEAAGDIMTSAGYKGALKAQIFDSSGQVLVPGNITLASLQSGVHTYVSDYQVLQDGNLAVFWSESIYTSNVSGNRSWTTVTSTSNMQIFGSDGKSVMAGHVNLGDPSAPFESRIEKIVSFDNGNFAVIWREYGFGTPYKMQIYDLKGGSLMGGNYTLSGSVDNISFLKDGSMVIFYNETKDGKLSFKSQSFDSTGNALVDIRSPFSIATALNNKAMPDFRTSPMEGRMDLLLNSLGSGNGLVPEIKAERVGSILRGLLAGRGEISGLESGQFGKGDEAMVAMVRGVLEQNALAVPLGGLEGAQTAELDLAMRLANIMKNPTADQKLMLDAIQALITDAEKQIDQAASPELKKASDDLLQMVAAVLIAQAIPDLLKEGDVSTIKNTFAELNSGKISILEEYGQLTKPYYSEMKGVLAKNLSLLQLNNIVSKTMLKEELNKLEPDEIDKILQKLKKAKAKSFEEEYILQQEEKLHKKYIDPNKRVLEEKMKDMMNGFTKRLSKVLEG